MPIIKSVPVMQALRLSKMKTIFLSVAKLDDSLLTKFLKQTGIQ